MGLSPRFGVILVLTLVASAYAASLRVAPLASSATATPTPSTTARATSSPAPAATSTPQPAADPLSLLNAEIAARNRGDINAAVALFADNATFTTAACRPCTTKAGITDTLQHLLIDHWQITTFNNQVSGNTVTGKFTLTSDSIRARGFQRIIANASLTEQNGLIVKFTSDPDPSDPETAQFLAAASGPPPTGLPSTGAGTSAAGPSRFWREYSVIGAVAVGLLLAGLGMASRAAKRPSVG